MTTNSDAAPVTDVIDPEGVGGKIDRYRLIALIGEGGFGEVFEAEQDEPVKRRVALKLIIPGMNTREVIARFAAERQALALMAHPNIARVFDAGATASGRPYFVMELVKGVPISSYCDEERLTLRERLALFEQVCQAVQHAHTKGVIHRDLKPGNVLVSQQDGVAVVKVIDFGIAKAISGRLTEQSLLTEQHRPLGTPMYMSPEQASGSSDIDTRTDVYSLGALLYEMLTGTTPFTLETLRNAAVAEVQRIIREVEPQRPSVRLSASLETLAIAARNCRAEPKQLRTTVHGELDWIVMKALEKERARRYETVDGLSNDVRRYLDGQAVTAVPPSRSYRISKFVRRNKLTVAAACAVTASLILGIAGFAWQANIATKRAAELEQVANFQAEMLSQIDPTVLGNELTINVKNSLSKILTEQNIGPEAQRQKTEQFNSLWMSINATDAARDLISKAILEPAVSAIETQFVSQPLVQAKLRHTLAQRYLELGFFGKALTLEDDVLAVRQALLGENHADTIRAQSILCEIKIYQGEFAKASPHCLITLNLAPKLFGEISLETATAMNSMAGLYYQKGEFADALPVAQRSLTIVRSIFGNNNAHTLGAINLLGSIYYSMGNYELAEPLYREGLAGCIKVHGPEHSDTLVAYNSLATLLDGQGKVKEAEAMYRVGLELTKKTRGEDNPDTLYAMNNLAQVLYAQGNLVEAKKYWRIALEKRRLLLGDDHPETIMSISDMASLLMAKGDFKGALNYSKEANERVTRVLGVHHPLTINSNSKMSSILRLLGKFDEAATFANAAVQESTQDLGPKHPFSLMSVAELAAVRVAQKKYSEALELITPIEAPTRQFFSGAKNYRVGIVLQITGEANLGLGHLNIAEKYLTEAHEILTATPAPAPRNLRECTQAIVELYTAWNKVEANANHDLEAHRWQAKLDALGKPQSSTTL